MSLEGITALQKSFFWHNFLWDSCLFSTSKEWRQFIQEKLQWYLDVFLWIILIVVYFKIMPSFSIWYQWKKNFFDGLSYVLKHKQDILFSLLSYKTFTSIITLLLSIFFFSHFFFMENIRFNIRFLYKV